MYLKNQLFFVNRTRGSIFFGVVLLWIMIIVITPKKMMIVIKRRWMKETCIFDSKDAEFTFCRLWARLKQKISTVLTEAYGDCNQKKRSVWWHACHKKIEQKRRSGWSTTKTHYKFLLFLHQKRKKKKKSFYYFSLPIKKFAFQETGSQNKSSINLTFHTF